MPEPAVTAVDAFDLPEWLGTDEVTWTAVTSLGSGHRVTGSLRTRSGETLDCDVLACDVAYPRAAVDEKWRSAAHHAWQLGETQLLDVDGRLTLAVPGTTVGVETALEAVRRLAKAVGAPASRFTVALRL